MSKSFRANCRPFRIVEPFGAVGSVPYGTINVEFAFLKPL